MNENFSPLSLYSTLTFDDDSEVHTFSEARRIRDNYFRRLQRACPDAKIIIYMGRGKSTKLIHTGNFAEVKTAIFKAFSMGNNGTPEPPEQDGEDDEEDIEKNMTAGKE